MSLAPSTGDPSSPLSLPGIWLISAVQRVNNMPMLLSSAIQQPGGTLIEVPERQQAIERIHQLRSGAKSLRAILTILAADGFILSHQGIRNVL